jgi:hypothetical protein
LNPVLIGLLALAVLDWLALRKGWLEHSPFVLAGLVSLLLIVTVVSMGNTLRVLWIDPAIRGRYAARLLLLSGILIAGIGGSVNWLLSLQGVVVLSEGEIVPLSTGAHLQEFEAGLLSNIDEMQLGLQLEELELVPQEDGGFYPRSLIRVASEADEEATTLSIDPFKYARFQKIRFHQGAFGFAPRIVILQAGREILDRAIPFLSRRSDSAEVSFEERFTVSREELEVAGRIDLRSFDKGMKGHATLHLEVLQGGEPIGQGSLLPGHFAEIDQGYRIGFAGLDRWSEIDISRKNYSAVVLAGGGLILLGALVWPLAWWRER